jgi:hypothetical protein
MGKQEDHNYSQKQGSRASIFEQYVEQQNLFRNEHNIKGFNHGVDNQPRKKSIDWFSKAIETTIDLFNPFSGGASLRRTSRIAASRSTYTSDYIHHDANGGSWAYSPPGKSKSKNWPLRIVLGLCSLPLILVLLIIAVGVGFTILLFWVFFRAIGEVLS